MDGTKHDDKELQRALQGFGEHQIGAPVARIEPLRAGLGTRRFFRLHFATGALASAVARVEGAGAAGSGPEPPLEPLRTRLEEAGLPVPKSYGEDPRAGITLLEDLGDLDLASSIGAASADQIRQRYLEACLLPGRLQRVHDVPAATRERRLDRALLSLKEERFVTESLPVGLGRPVRPTERDAVSTAFSVIASEIEAAPLRLAHRDFQSSNLMLAPGRGKRQLVMIDVQGAFFAPPEYDLVCLLRDSYVELRDELRVELAAAGRGGIPDPPSASAFERRFDLLTVARKAKDHAFFVAAGARGDRRYLRYLAPTARYLREASARLASTDRRFEPMAQLVADAALETTP